MAWAEVTRSGIDRGVAFAPAVPGLAARGLYRSKGLGHLAGVVARSHERAAGHLAEAQPAGERAKFVELLVASGKPLAASQLRQWC